MYEVDKMPALSTFPTTYDAIFLNTSKLDVWSSEPNIRVATAVIGRPIHVIIFTSNDKLATVIRYSINPDVKDRIPLKLGLYGNDESNHFVPLLSLLAETDIIPVQGAFCTNLDENFRIKTDSYKPISAAFLVVRRVDTLPWCLSVDLQSMMSKLD